MKTTSKPLFSVLLLLALTIPALTYGSYLGISRWFDFSRMQAATQARSAQLQAQGYHFTGLIVEQEDIAECTKGGCPPHVQLRSVTAVDPTFARAFRSIHEDQPALDQWSIDGRSYTAMAFPHLKAYFAVKIPSREPEFTTAAALDPAKDCLATLSGEVQQNYKKLGEETILGYRTVKVSTWGDSVRGQILWMAPALGCFELKAEMRTPMKDGIEIITRTTKKITLGPPEDAYFRVPSDFRHESPLEVMAANERALGTDTATVNAKIEKMKVNPAYVRVNDLWRNGRRVDLHH